MFRIFRRAHPITRLGLTPPRPAPDRHGLAVVLIVRDEQTHIAEWARFHALAGVRAFHVYDNGCTDGTIAALQAAVPGMATVIPWDQKLADARTGAEIHNQVLAYAHAVRNFGARYRWMSFIDVDEFLVPVRDESLPAALAALEAHANISLPWHMFGRNGHDAMPGGGVLANYTRRNPDPMSDAKGLRNFKMIVDPCRVTAMKVHSIETDGSADTVNDRGTRTSARGREAQSFYSADRIQLNHYYTRSDAELRAKIARGPNLTTPDADHLRRVMRKVDNIEAGEIEDRRALEFLARIGAGTAV
ncbi:glycosyltransferase family 92 protein [Frigidibacter sp. MR17.24]|uniref:glycosyltransferase family 92 protein n=1 Tax=Frigidibacter sp. MR17.24 TaxID=3127345 RepID=UPI003012E3EA